MLGFPIPDIQIQTRKSSEKTDMTLFGQGAQRAFKMSSLIQLKLNKIQASTSERPFLCSPVSQDRLQVPQDAKAEAPNIPHDKFGHRKPKKNLQS